MDRKEWERICQPFELDWQRKESAWRSTDRWLLVKEKLLKIHSLSFSNYAGKLIIDLGSGPRSMCEWFEDASIICIDPLANEYLSMQTGWLELPRIVAVFSQPAEDRIADLEGIADFVWCNNVLDHCFNPSAVVNNLAFYLKTGSSFFLATDIKPPYLGHPGTGGREAVIGMVLSASLTTTYTYDKRSGDTGETHHFTIIGEKV